MKSRRLLILISTVTPVAKVNKICNPLGLKKVQIHFAMDVTMDIGL
jgi:hypothetical protein